MNNANIKVLVVVMDYGNKKKGEIRSRENIDIEELAKLLTGGGHKNAAGFSNHKSIEEIILLCEDYLKGVCYENN